jgi:hypothetical protein
MDEEYRRGKLRAFIFITKLLLILSLIGATVIVVLVATSHG